MSALLLQENAPLGIVAAKQARENKIRLRHIYTFELPYFKWLVQTYVSHYYPETEDLYTEALAAPRVFQDSPCGLSTLNRTVWSVEQHGVSGFFVATEKTGGRVKLGPIVLAPEFRREKIGFGVVDTLAAHYSHLGYRKFYMTIPASNFAANAFARATGFSIEARLRQHYSASHDECLWGRTIHHNLTCCPNRTANQANWSFPSTINKAVPRLSREEFNFLSTTDRLSEVHPNQNLGFRRLFQTDILEKRISILCTPKRGGAIKLDFLMNQGTTAVLPLLDEVETFYVAKSRKLYAVLTPSTTETIQACLMRGYKIEGKLCQPYRPTADELILSKLTP